MMVVLLSTKLKLWQNVFDKFKELTMTFSPVAMLKYVRIMLAIAAFYDYEIWQMDVKTAFLNGFLEKELYMMQPKVFSILKVLTKCANSSDPSMDWRKHLRVGIYTLMR